MSIIKFANGKNRGAHALKEAVDYILDPAKTCSELTFGYGIDKEQAYQDMRTVQALLGKASGRRYIHYILSFDKDIELERAYDICAETASYYDAEYQYLWAIHTNTENLHMHVLLNAVNIRTGKKFSQAKSDMLKFRDYINTVLERYSANPIGKEPQQYAEIDDIFEIDYEWDEVQDDVYVGPFGNVDEEEIRIIEEAEKQSSLVRDVVSYFEGEVDTLPEGLDYYEALEIYEQWEDSQQWDEEY